MTEQVPAPIWRVVELIRDAEDGHLPLPGGSLAQTQWFMDARRFWRGETERLKHDAGN